MARTTGPVLAIGAITIANRTVFNEQPMDWRIPMATAIAAGMFALAERGWGDGATLLAWTALVAVIFTRVDPAVPAPAESALRWWQQKGN